MPGRYFGKYSGIVRDNRDSEKLGQLQLSVPAIFPPEDVVKARAALPYGFFFLPELEAKVWVEFEGGDPGLPIWTGIQYVAGEWAAEVETDPPQKRVIKSVSGHIVTFNDTSGEESIEIQDGVNNHIITLDKNGIKVTDGMNKHEIVLDAKGVQIKDGTNSNEIVMVSDGVKISEASGGKVEITPNGMTLDTGKGAIVKIGASGVEVNAPTVKVSASMVDVAGSTVRLANGAMPVARMGDSGIGNLGAPVVIMMGNPMVLA